MQLDVCKGCGDTRPFIHVLAALFGMGSNLAVNGIWVELPILVFFLPEGWSLGSYMTIILQLANIAPLLYTAGNILCPKKVTEKPAIYFIAFLGSAASFLLAYLWDMTSIVFGAVHSTALFSLHFCLSIMDCTSSIVFITAMGVFQEPYMTTYFLGEGMSGLLPGLVALAQGVGDIYCTNQTTETSEFNNGSWYNSTSFSFEPTFREPRFSVMYFFIFLGSMQVISAGAYTMLMYFPACKREHIRPFTGEEEIAPPDNDKPEQIDNNNMTITKDDVTTNEDPSAFDAVKYKTGYHSKAMKIERKTSSGSDKSRQKVTRGQYAYLLLLIGWTTFLANSFLLSVQSYSVLPYGSEAYHLAVTLATIANPAACVLALFLPLKSRPMMGVLTGLGTLVGVYIVVLAFLSPNPFLKDSMMGAALSVSVN